MLNKITFHYRKQCGEKYEALKNNKISYCKNTNLKNIVPDLYDDIEIKQSYILNYTCDCYNCEQANINNIDRIKKQQNKNKLYLCKIRTGLICNYILEQINLNNKDIILIVPTEQPTINKIMSLILEESNGNVIKKNRNILEYNGSKIYLYSALHFIEGFDQNLKNIGSVLLNCFYSHMYIRYYEELIYTCWKLREYSNFVIINDNIEIFSKENNFIKEIFEDLKIITPII